MEKLLVFVQLLTKFSAKAVVITTGTALRGEIILGELKYSSGPNNSLASIGLADNLKELGLKLVVSKQEHHHGLKQVLSIMTKQKFNQVTKNQIISHSCQMMKIISKIKFLAG